MSNGRRASESSVIVNKPHIRDDQEGSFSGSVTPCTSSPVHTMSRSRRTGANIIASALAMARSHPSRPETPNESSTASSSQCQSDVPIANEKSPAITSTHLTTTSKSLGKAVPKISLTEHSEDDYGGSSPEHQVKSKKSSDSGLKAMREKVCDVALLFDLSFHWLVLIILITNNNLLVFCSFKGMILLS